ncbi:MAG: sodium ion-translocating decarboxylase subunit beta [Phycisphaerales bacterium]|nr:sodium ion-translocating decarboxylase subunit beta [Phycisphaerales bacterium]MBT7171745.1 sodium ion-translocating decarboxylase subunit beta [Phycisphaerales bacterium]
MAIMVAVGLLLLYLAIKKGFEPLLLIPIGFGCILANIPGAGVADMEPPAPEYAAYIAKQTQTNPAFDVTKKKAVLDGFNAMKQANYDAAKVSYEVDHKEWETKKLAAATAGTEFSDPAPHAPKTFKPYAIQMGFMQLIYQLGVQTGLFPLLIFMGVGAMTDFGPLLANPKTALLGAAAQVGIFGALFLALMVFGFNIAEASAIGIIGGADGPTSIFVARKLAPDLLGAIAVAAYSYMALVPIIQPPVMRLLTSKAERKIKMEQLRHVSKLEKMLFPLIVLGLCALLLPSACPLIGMLMFGNLAKESGVVDRLSNTMQNALINIVTIMLGLAVGMKLAADKFLNPETLFILALGLLAFVVGTASGVLMAKLMNLVSKRKINPLIGAAGVSAVPMAARVVNKVGLEEDEHNFLLMHAMGPNVAGVIGSAVAAGALLALCGALGY